MKNLWAKSGGVIGYVLVLLLVVPAEAADSRSGNAAVAVDELNQRSKQPAASQNGGMSERGVRNMVFYAFSLIPDEVKGPDGTMVKVDKADPNKFVIPEADARRVIRAATRSA